MATSPGVVELQVRRAIGDLYQNVHHLTSLGPTARKSLWYPILIII